MPSDPSGVMTPAQAALLFGVFQAWARDGDASANGAERELACLVLYPDGSGGLALDVPVGERPPTTWDHPDADVYAPQKALLHVRWLSTAEAIAAFPSAAPATPSVELSADQAVILRAVVAFLAARDRVTELERRRNLCRCARVAAAPAGEAVRPCWEIVTVDPAVAPCGPCATRQDLTKRMREASAACGPAGRELRRHLRQLGLLVDVDVDAPAVGKAPRRRTRR
jgi:hypothetical protein